ncbi:acetyltransferase [Vibrio vulnificus]|nr:acetyltransferase [Vibrio vulnificus]EGR1514679.1 acetyltransferase [Vibrio vulnificus]
MVTVVVVEFRIMHCQPLRRALNALRYRDVFNYLGINISNIEY